MEALTAYENRDFRKTVSELVPQIESMLRELLRLLEIPTRKAIRVGAGSELKNINDVLVDERVLETLDENLVLFLRAVYIDKRALNLRNNFAHGILSTKEFNEGIASLTVMSLVALAAIGPHTIYLAHEP